MALHLQRRWRGCAGRRAFDEEITRQLHLESIRPGDAIGSPSVRQGILRAHTGAGVHSSSLPHAAVEGLREQLATRALGGATGVHVCNICQSRTPKSKSPSRSPSRHPKQGASHHHRAASTLPFALLAEAWCFEEDAVNAMKSGLDAGNKQAMFDRRTGLRIPQATQFCSLRQPRFDRRTGLPLGPNGEWQHELDATRVLSRLQRQIKQSGTHDEEK